VSPEARKARLFETVKVKMAASNRLGDFEAVILLGQQAEKDLALVHDLRNDWSFHARFLDRMGGAFASLGKYAEAVRYGEQLAAFGASTERFMEQGRALMNVGAMRLTMGELVEARATFEKVRDIGVRGGYFEMESKSCDGLSDLARMAGRTEEGLEFAEQALLAAGCMQDDEFGKHMTEASALDALIACSDLAAPAFDEALIHRYGGLARALAHQVDSVHHVKVQKVWVTRHAAMGRPRECADACREIIELSGGLRVAQNADVQEMAAYARDTLHKNGWADTPTGIPRS
jgi:tetratricopeptide (TPR) repeat protein